jgi:hypothetical protein
VLGGSCIVTPIRLLKGKHHPLLGTNCRKITISLIMALCWALECNGLIATVEGRRERDPQIAPPWIILHKIMLNLGHLCSARCQLISSWQLNSRSASVVLSMARGAQGAEWRCVDFELGAWVRGGARAPADGF